MCDGAPLTNLVRPINITLQVFGDDFILRRLGRIAQRRIAIFYFALRQRYIHWTAGKILYLPFVILGIVLFFGGLYVIGATITFWTIDSIEVMNIFTYGSSELISYPMNIYPDWLRILLYLCHSGSPLELLSGALLSG